jgi:hypothetical protein
VSADVLLCAACSGGAHCSSIVASGAQVYPACMYPAFYVACLLRIKYLVFPIRRAALYHCMRRLRSPTPA